MFLIESAHRILKQAYKKHQKPVKWLTKQDHVYKYLYGLPVEPRVGIDKSIKLVIKIN